MQKILESKKWLTMICLATAFSLGLTACSDDDDDATDNNPPVVDTDAGDITEEGDDDGKTDDEEDGKTDDEEDGNTNDEEDGNTNDEDDGNTDDEDDGNTDDEEDGNTNDEDIEFSPRVCDDGSNENGFVAETSELIAAQGAIVVIETTSETFPRDQMVLELYEEMFTPGFTYEVGVTYYTDDIDPVSCMNCLTIDTNCPEGTASTGSCEESYAAGAGEFVFTEIDADAGIFKATLTGAQFINLADENSGWCIDSYEFDIQPDSGD